MNFVSADVPCEKGKRFGLVFRLKICKCYIVSSTVLKISSSFPVPPSSAAFPQRLSVTKTPDRDSESCANMDGTWEDSDSEASHHVHKQQLPKISMKVHVVIFFFFFLKVVRPCAEEAGRFSVCFVQPINVIFI